VGFINLDGRSLSSTLPEVIENGEAPGSLDRLFFDANEKLLLKSFIEWVVEHDPDLISAWNGNGFDLPYLFKRMEKVGIDPSKLARETRFPGQSDVPPDAWLTRSNTPRIVGRTCYDMMDAWEATKFSEVKCTLENAANMELGEGKVDHADQSIYEMWRDDPALLLEYNAVDVRLTVEVDKAAGVLTDRMELKNAVGVSFEETLYAKDFIGMMVRRKLHEWDLVGPTKADGKPDNSDFEGAFTFPAYEGVRSNVISIDLASLYPFTMWMLNSSPEVLVEVYEDGEAALDALEGTPEFENHERAIAPNGAVFDLTKHGLFRELVDEAMEIAAEAKRKRNAAPAGSEEEEKWSEKYNSRKAIRNSLYGVLGYIWFFLYDKDVAGAVTTMGQRVIQRTSEYINSETTGEVIYGDTDSCYIAWPEHWSKKRALEATQQAVNTLNDTEYPALAEEWGMPGDESKWEIEIEDYSERFYQAGKKKRYAKRVTWKEGMAFGEVMDEPEIEIKGFEYKRSDTPPLLADLQKNVLQGIMAGMSDSDLRGLVFEAGEKITRTGVDWDYIGIPGGIGKRLGTYDNPGAHIRASKNANELLGLGFGKGDKPSRVYLEPKDVTVGETTERIDVIAFDRGEELEPIESQISVDVPTMREKIIAKPMGRILDPIDIDVDAALSGQEQGALTDWV
jgi:DNA polymerase I